MVCVQACRTGASESGEWLDLDDLPEIPVVERTVIGGFEATGPDAFGKVSSIAVLTESDAIAVADGTVQEIRLFSLSGQPLGMTGGRGGGPGEFRAIRQMSESADGSLRVWDVQQSRVTTFDRDLRLEGAHRADLGPVQAISPEFVGFLANGGFVLRDMREAMGMRDLPEGIRQDTVRLYTYSSTGRLEDTVASLPDEPKWFRNREGTWGRQDLIFGRQLTSVVVGDEVWVGSTGAWSFARHGADGTALGEVQLGVRPRPASPEEVDAERERRSGEVRVRNLGRTAISTPTGLQDAMVVMAEAERDAIREVASNDTLPAYDLTISGPEGPLFVREYPRPLDTTVRWVVLNRNGSAVGWVRLPRETEIKAVAPGLIVVLERDMYDAPVVRILEMERRTGAGS